MKNLLNLGKALNKNEQKVINGGGKSICSKYFICPGGSSGGDGTVCILNGGIWGTMQNGLCCS